MTQSSSISATCCTPFRQVQWKLGKLFQTPSSKRLGLLIAFCVKTQSALLFPSRCEATPSCGSCPTRQPAPSLQLLKHRQIPCHSAGHYLADLTLLTQKEMSQAPEAACGMTSMGNSKTCKLESCSNHQRYLHTRKLSSARTFAAV